jgi:enamine deaminase RidA (YjgF/YER057c/UK114 family)/catechol 2,3-dioxygenase-like lactoylglutathione lyase family enzyme
MFVLDHVSITVRDLERARPFYDAIMSALGVEKVYDRDDAVGYGERNRPGNDAHTYMSVFASREAAGDARRHACFRAQSEDDVRRFFEAGLGAGGRSNGDPGVRSQYHEGYYAAFLTDPEGNRVEAVFHRGSDSRVRVESLSRPAKTAIARPMERRSVYSGTPWEPEVGYCRAKRVGDWIVVSGTVAVDDEGVAVAPGDVYVQTSYAIAKIARSLRQLGAGLGDVVRTRTYLTDIERFEDFARAHREAFAGIDPAATCVQVARLVSSQLVVEIEADAVLGGGAAE